jgi:hypothetical protein
MRPATIRFLLTSALAGLSLPASAGVIVVDAAGGGDFTSLEAAVAAAADGDTLLVRPGHYGIFDSSMLISGRSLVIAADGTGPVLTKPFGILGTGERIVLRGLTIEAGPSDGNTGLHCVGGDVFVEGCTIRGRDGDYFTGSIVGGTAVTSSGGRLVLKDCVLEGGRGSDNQNFAFVNAQPGGNGLHVFGTATIAIHGGTVTAGAGGDDVDGFGHGSIGGVGLLANFGAKLLLAGCTMTGGDGGSSGNPGSFGPFSYAGGDAVSIANDTSLDLLDATLVGGAPGQDGGGLFGTPGDPLESSLGNVVVQFPGAYRGLGFSAPAPEGGMLTLSFDGAAGDLVGLFVSATPTALPGPQGLFHLGAPVLGPFTLGPVGPSGTLALPFGVPDFGFGPDDAVTLYAQALVKPAGDAKLLSSPTTALLTDTDP